tara:strand:- start:228 stop:650 length:423 start_codon:yes stop_codon:yes gene_type:complete
MAVEIKINPIDFEPDVALGIDLPMIDGAGAAFKLNYMSIDQAVANAKNLILTDKGERIMLPEFGCNLKSILFDPIDESINENLEVIIKDSFDYWLPYIFINSLDVTNNADRNRINILLSISLQDNKLDTRSIEIAVENNT